MALSSGTRLGPYEILSPLGAGGMGEVYRAKDTRLDRTVAVKVLPTHLSTNPDLRQRFEREARAVSSLNHPNICTLHDVGSQDGIDYLVMEYLEGETLADRLQKGSLPSDHVLRLGFEIADALDKAHKNSIVHRDLKPGNIMLTKSGAKLMDFGLAKLQPPASQTVLSGVSALATEANKNLTAEGSIVGTFQYMAPEQLEGKDLDSRTDIFALGVVLYEMITGKKAFAANSQAGLIAAILEKDPQPISDIQPMTPPALDHVVRKCLEKDPDHRWQSAHDVAAELQWVAQAGSQAGVARPAVELRQTKTRILKTLAVLGWILAIVAFAIVLRNRSALELSQQPFHAEIVPPANITAVLAGGSISISQDGSRIMMPTAGGLVVDNLQTGDMKQLDGTAGAIFPFWSFDSRSVGFFADGKLKRIPAEGGPVQIVADAPQGRGGAWGPDDTILFAPDISGPLMRVPASGGSAVPVTTVESENRTHRNPWVLPDGKHFLYVSRETRSENFGSIAMSAIGDSKGTIVVEHASNPQYANGYLFWVRDGNLLAQPFDPASGKLSGTPTPLTSDVEYYNPKDIGNFSVSAGGMLAWRKSDPVPDQVVKVDLQTRQVQTIGEPGLYSFRDVDKSGHRVLLSKQEATGGVSDLWVMDLERAQTTRVTFNSTSGVIRGAFSPDGSQLAVSSFKGSGWSQALWLQSASGGGTARKLLDQSNFLVEQWSADGKTLVGSVQDPRTSFDVAYLSIDDPSKIRKFVSTPFDERSPRLSPDGKWITYVSNESGPYEIYLSDFPGAARKWQVSKGDAISPGIWTPEGNAISYIKKDNKEFVRVPVAVDKDGLKLGTAGTIELDTSALGSGFFNFGMLSNSAILTTKPVSSGHVEPIKIIRNWQSLLIK